MGLVSVYRVGADPSRVFASEARASDLRHAAWLGWLPLTFVVFGGPGVAVAGDTWLTAPLGSSDRERRVVAGDVTTALGAAGELIARRDRGLTAFTNHPADFSSDGAALDDVGRPVGR